MTMLNNTVFCSVARPFFAHFTVRLGIPAVRKCDKVNLRKEWLRQYDDARRAIANGNVMLSNEVNIPQKEDHRKMFRVMATCANGDFFMLTLILHKGTVRDVVAYWNDTTCEWVEISGEERMAQWHVKPRGFWLNNLHPLTAAAFNISVGF